MRINVQHKGSETIISQSNTFSARVEGVFPRTIAEGTAGVNNLLDRIDEHMGTGDDHWNSFTTSMAKTVISWVAIEVDWE